MRVWANFGYHLSLVELSWLFDPGMAKISRGLSWGGPVGLSLNDLPWRWFQEDEGEGATVLGGFRIFNLLGGLMSLVWHHPRWSNLWKNFEDIHSVKFRNHQVALENILYSDDFNRFQASQVSVWILSSGSFALELWIRAGGCMEWFTLRYGSMT